MNHPRTLITLVFAGIPRLFQEPRSRNGTLGRVEKREEREPSAFIIGNVGGDPLRGFSRAVCNLGLASASTGDHRQKKCTYD